MKLTEHVYLVGGGPFTGFGLTSGADSHIYLIEGGDRLVLVDVGLGLDEGFGQMVENIRGHGFDPDDIDVVALTHYHGDHAGGARRAQEEFGAELAIHHEAAASLESADEEATGLSAARDAGVFPETARLEPCAVQLRLDEGDEIPVGPGRLRFVATPGHCRGHGSFLLTGLGDPALFAGDALFWAGRILLQAVPDCDLQASLESLRRLASLDFQGFYPGHGAITINGGGVHAQMARSEVDSLSVPKSII